MKFIIYAVIKDTIVKTRIKITDKGKPKDYKYLKRLVQLTGGDNKAINSKSLSNLLKTWYQTFNKKLQEKIFTRIEKLPETLLILLVDKYGLHGILLFVAYEQLLRSDVASTVKSSVFMIAFTIKILAYANLTLDFLDYKKQLTVLTKDKNNNSYFFSLKRLFTLTSDTGLSVSQSESNDPKQIMILTLKTYALALGITSGLSIEIASLFSEQFQKALLDNLNIKILLLRSLVGLLPIFALQLSNSDPRGFARYANLSLEELQLVSRNYTLLFAILTISPIGTLRHFCLPKEPTAGNIKKKTLDSNDNRRLRNILQSEINDLNTPFTEKKVSSYQDILPQDSSLMNNYENYNYKKHVPSQPSKFQ